MFIKDIKLYRLVGSMLFWFGYFISSMIFPQSFCNNCCKCLSPISQNFFLKRKEFQEVESSLSICNNILSRATRVARIYQEYKL